MTYVNMMPAELAEKYAREKLWLQKTVFDILTEQAAAHPGRVAIKDHREPISYGALKDRIERAAQFYRSAGVKRGDVVTIHTNRIDFATAFIALELIGAIANKVNPDFCARELDYMSVFPQSFGLCLSKGMERFRLCGHGAEPPAGKPRTETVDRRRRRGRGHAWTLMAVAAERLIAPADRVHMDPDQFAG